MDLSIIKKPTLEYTHERLGSGNQAVIEKGILTYPDGKEKLIAIKIFKSKKKNDVIDRERKLLLDLQGTPGIVKIITDEIDQLDDKILLELASEGDLFTIIEHKQNKVSCPAITYSHVYDILEQLLKAIQKLYSLGYVHRDIKPENVLVYKFTPTQLELGLTDFGYVVPVNSYEAVAGTLGYLPPSCREEDYHLYNGSEDLYGVALIAKLFLTFVPGSLYGPEHQLITRMSKSHPKDVPKLLIEIDSMRKLSNQNRCEKIANLELFRANFYMYQKMDSSNKF